MVEVFSLTLTYRQNQNGRFIVSSSSSGGDEAEDERGQEGKRDRRRTEADLGKNLSWN